MGERDITQKTLESYNDVFADIINALIFDGKQIVEADTLNNAQTFSQYKKTISKLMNFRLFWVTKKIRNRCKLLDVRYGVIATDG